MLREDIIKIHVNGCLSEKGCPLSCSPADQEYCYGTHADQILALVRETVKKGTRPDYEIENEYDDGWITGFESCRQAILKALGESESVPKGR